GVDAATRGSAPGPPLCARLLGTAIDPPADRPPCLAPALRAGLARSQRRGGVRLPQPSPRRRPGSTATRRLLQPWIPAFAGMTNQGIEGEEAAPGPIDPLLTLA